MDEEIKLADIFFVIRKNWLIILFIFIVIFGIAMDYSISAEKVYKTESLLVLEDHGAASYLLDMPNQRFNIETQLEIIRSGSVLGSVYDTYLDYGDFDIEVNILKDSNIIQIVSMSSDPELAKDTANALAEKYINYTLDMRENEALEVSKFITEQINLHKTELDALNKLLLNVESTAAELEEVILNSLDSFNKQLDDLKTRETELENTVRTPEDDLELGRIKQLIDAYEAQVAEKENELKELRSSREYVDNQLEKKSLESKIEAKEKLYNFLLSRREEVSILSKESASGIRIVQPAQLPVEPYKPNIPINLSFGALAGLVVGLGFAFIKENIRNTYRSIKAIEEDFDTVTLGVIPYTKSFKNIGKSDKSKFPLLEKNPDQFFAESIRMLRTNVKFLLKDTDMKILSITSPEIGDGKSTVAANLAMALAQNDMKVLLVDANIRNPTLNKMLAQPKTPGLTDVILGNSELADAIRKTSLENLFLLRAGSESRYPSELFGSNTMKKLVNKMRSMTYDVVIFDNSSLIYSESAAMAQDSDGALMVVALDKTNKDSARQAKADLEKVGVNIIGLIITHAK